MSWFLITFYFYLILIFSCISDASHENYKLPSAIVVGTVYCDTCFQKDFSKTSHFISGATVEVECKENGNSKQRFRKEVKTDKNGEFKVHLPFTLSKHVNKIEGCYVKLIKSSEPHCAIASLAKSSSLNLKSIKQGMHIFSAGVFTFKPQKQPKLCHEKLNVHNLKELNSKKVPLDLTDYESFAPPVQDTVVPYNIPSLPKLPELPSLPKLPPLPSLPDFPRGPTLPSIPGKSLPLPFVSPFSARPGFFFPPNSKPHPFQPPNSILPQNPLEPPSPLIPNDPNPVDPNLPPLIRNQFQPPLAELTHLPSIPVLTPSSSSQLSFTLSIPSFPFPSSHPNHVSLPSSSSKQTSP